jgi:steroid 5-alpha reductase family enzyme
MPAHDALVRAPQELGVSDYVLATLSLVALALEFTSDNQQWSFQVSYSFTGTKRILSDSSQEFQAQGRN